MTRKLVESTFMSLNGIVSNPQNWGSPYWDDQHFNYAKKLLAPAESLLLGRETYEIFAASWPTFSDSFPEYLEYASKLNSMPKHVASRTLTEATWNSTIIEGDVVSAVKELKAQDGGDILKFGTGILDIPLIENKLVDEYHFWIFPVMVKDGARLFDSLDTMHLDLIETTRFDSGIMVMTYTNKP